MKNALEKITEFLNVAPEKLEKLPIDILIKMQSAIRDDDYMNLHSLGYNLNK